MLLALLNFRHLYFVVICLTSKTAGLDYRCACAAFLDYLVRAFFFLLLVIFFALRFFSGSSCLRCRSSGFWFWFLFLL
jgi:hypothetical protein